ncbi:hypothetical protein FRC06_009623, partial [Ceratobasidium sp. 370]
MATAGNLGKPDYFDTADLLLTTGLTNMGRDAHLKSRLYVGQSPWVNNKQLMADVDKLPHGPEWEVYNIKLDEPIRRTRRNHSSYLFKRSVVATFRDLMANPDFKDKMDYAPRREWTAADRKCRVFGESSGGEWWWRTQEGMADKSATIVPLIISHDRTSLSTMSALEKVFEELRVVSETGIVVLCADGRYRKAYPVIRGVMLDFEEQLQMSGVMKNRCPKCLQEVDGRGSGQRTNTQTLCALHAWIEGEGRGQADWLRLHLLNWSIAAAGEEMVDLYFILMPVAEGMRHFSQGVSKLQQWTGHESKEAAKQLLPIVASLDANPWDQDFVHLARALLDFIYRAQASRMTEDDVARLEKTLEEVHKYKGVLIQLKVFQDDSQFDAIAKLHMIGHLPADTREMGTPNGFSTEAPEHQHIESKRAWRTSSKVRPTPQMIKFLQRYEALRIHHARMDAYLGRSIPGGGKQRKMHIVLGEDKDVLFHPSWEPAGNHGKPEMDGGNGEDVDVGSDVNEDRPDDEEGEDKDQQHFPGRMRTAADARRHVVYPNPTLSIAWKPTAGRILGIDIMSKYGAPDFIPVLHAYLNVHGTQRLPPNFLPTAYHKYP